MMTVTGSTKKVGKVYLKVPSDTFYLDLVRKVIVDIATKVGFSKEEAGKIEMSVDEACTNVIKHAYVERKDIRLHRDYHLRRTTDIRRSIDLRVHVDDKKISVTILDQGRPFEFNKYGKLNLDAYLAEMQIGGLGIYVIKNFMDSVKYRHTRGVGNELKMIKYFKPKVK